MERIILQMIIRIIEKTPNDSKLGEKLRKLYYDQLKNLK